MLSQDELKHRIEAARILRDISQVELERLFHADGLGKGDAGRVERGELPMDKVRRDAFCRHLRVPERWFLAEDVDEIVGMKPGQLTPDEIRRAAELLPQLLAGDQELPQAPGRTPRAGGEPGRQAPGGEGGQ